MALKNSSMNLLRRRKNKLIQWIKRERVEKEEGHVAWVDYYLDTETGVQYLSLNGNLTPRLM